MNRTGTRPPIAAVFRIAFWSYACLLFIATHWPALVVPGPEGSDKLVHVGAFGVWTFLASLCGWFGRALSARNLILTAIVSAANAGVDELLQAIPFVRRSCEWNDYFANLIGVIGAMTVLFLLGRLLAPRMTGEVNR